MEAVTLNDVNLALTQRCGTAEPLFRAQRFFAEACEYGGDDAESPRGAYCALVDIIELFTGVPHATVIELIRAAWRDGAYRKEVRDEHIRFYAEAWDISIEDAAQRLFGGES